MIKEVIVVEGKSDEEAVRSAVHAETISTHGFGLNAKTIDRIRMAERARGIIILTDPDHAGEQIRKKLEKLFPDAKHAWIARDLAKDGNDIGVENASPEIIREAIEKARPAKCSPQIIFSMSDLVANGLIGTESAAVRRDFMGRYIGIGYGNAKTFLNRLNVYGITRDDFDTALTALAALNMYNENETSLPNIGQDEGAEKPEEQSEEQNV